MAPIRWQPDRTTPKPPWPVPSLGTALGRGLVGRCPVCGKGRLFDGFLRVAAQCEHCGAPLGLARADDAPPYFTILIVGHIVIPAMLIMQKMADPPIWLLSVIFVPLTRDPGDRAAPAGQRRHRRADAELQHAEVRRRNRMSEAAVRHCRGTLVPRGAGRRNSFHAAAGAGGGSRPGGRRSRGGEPLRAADREVRASRRADRSCCISPCRTAGWCSTSAAATTRGSR